VIDSRSHFPDLSREISRDLTNLCEILLNGPSKFGQATLNESVPSLGRQQHRVVYATCRYFANKEQLRNSMKHEAVVYTTVGMTRQLPRVSPYKAVGNAAAAVSRLLQHSSELRVTKSDAAIDTLHAPATTTVSPVLCCTQ